MNVFGKQENNTEKISSSIKYDLHYQGDTYMQILTNQFQKELKEHGGFQFPLLISNERLSKYDSNSFLWHWHPEIELTLITQGQMIYEINNEEFHLCQGEALFGNTGVLHAGRMYENMDCEYVSITFDPRLIYSYENSIFYLKYVSPFIQNLSLFSICFDLTKPWHKEIIKILNELVAIHQQQQDTYEIDVLIKLLEFWKVLYLNYDTTQTITSSERHNYERIRSILSFIEENYSHKITLEEIADHIHICKGECCRIFKQYMKIPLFRFILEYRIEKSLKDLVASNDSIGDIAAKAGFGDSNYYSHTFYKVKGCSPTEYRKKTLKHS